MTEISRAEFSAVMATAARSLQQVSDPTEVLQSIVDVAVFSIAGTDGASVTLVQRKGDLTTRAATSDLVRALDQLQYDTGQGPCLEAMATQGTVVVPRIRHEQRWPAYVAHAVRRGVTAQLAVNLHLDEQAATMTSLNLYATSAEEFSDDAIAMAEVFAVQAAAALGYARVRHQLSQGIVSRELIGKAIGITMQRYQIDEKRAFAVLVRTSAHTNVKLRDVAQGMVDELNRKQPSD